MRTPGPEAAPQPVTRILVVTAVPAERDAVAAAFPALDERRLPGVVLHATRSTTTARTAAPAGTPGATHAPGSPRPGRAGRPPRWDLTAAGVGPAGAAAATAAALTAAALDGEPYGLVVSAGIGGGFPPAAAPGSLVVADAITVADLGAATPDGFVPVTGLGFGTVTHRPPPSLVRRVAAATAAHTGTVLTVSTVTGTAARAADLRTRHPEAVAEAMEGFGVAEAAAAHGVPVLEVRAVSNTVGPRDRAAWRIDTALDVLTGAFAQIRDVLAIPDRTAPTWEPGPGPAGSRPAAPRAPAARTAGVPAAGTQSAGPRGAAPPEAGTQV